MSLKIDCYSEQFKQLKPTFIGNHLPWLRIAREQSLAGFLRTGFPSRREEDWRYTDLTFLAQQTFTWTSRNESITSELIAKHHLEDTNNQLVFIDGYFSATLSQTSNLPAGVTLISLNEALMNQPENIEPYLKEDLNSALINLNTAFIADGIFLHIAKNIHVALPIYILFLSTDISNNMLLNNRNIVLLEENSQVTLFEEHATLDATNTKDAILAKNTFTKIILKDGAQLNYYKLQQEAKNTIHIARTDIDQSRNSQLYSYSISLGAKLARDNLNINLNDTGASCELNGFYALSGHQHTDHHTRIDHYHPHGTSNECYKGILTDHAKGVFNGKVVVHPKAQKTQSQQINKNLLLSKTAEMNTKPELEIYADDVQCTHGATVGQLELDALFYLRSRGIDEIDAVNLLTHAFCDDVLNRMRHEQIASYVKKAVDSKIG